MKLLAVPIISVHYTHAHLQLAALEGAAENITAA